ncbi:MAG: DUF72 domain-containing protein [Bdellovibrionota bacterium]
MFHLDAAQRLPQDIRFGTSTWTYPGWKGTIYHREYKSEKEFKATSLGEYATFPLFRTVGIDSTFYSPPTAKTLESYASMVPESFLWVSKVWERVTIPQYPTHPRYGALSGKVNPDFLNPDCFLSKVLPPYQESVVKSHTGPFVFQFGTIAKQVMAPDEFLKKLDSFFRQLPKDFHYATEIRNPELLENDYFALLNEHGATHCFNHWHYMPPLAEQMKRAAAAGGLQAPFYVARLLTPLGVSYENAVRLFSPYDSMKRPNLAMRKDAVRIVKRAMATKRSAFVIVNNRCEGYAPGTINAIIAEAAEDADDD